MLINVKLFLLMFFCYFIILGDGYDEIKEFNVILDLKKILFVESLIFILGIFINVFRVKVIL